MKIGEVTVAPTIALSSIILISATSFHIGYFQRVGIEFISLMSASDIVGFFAFAGPFFLFIWGIFYLTSVDLVFDRALMKENLIGGYLSWTINKGVVVYLVLFCLPAILLIGGIFYIFGSRLTTDITFLLFFLMQTMFITKLCLQDFSIEGRLTVRRSALLVFVLIWTCIKSGHIYVDNIAGTECTVSYKETEGTMIFLRALGNGFLLKEGDSFSYVPQAYVSYLKC